MTKWTTALILSAISLIGCHYITEATETESEAVQITKTNLAATRTLELESIASKRELEKVVPPAVEKKEPIDPFANGEFFHPRKKEPIPESFTWKEDPFTEWKEGAIWEVDNNTWQLNPTGLEIDCTFPTKVSKDALFKAELLNSPGWHITGIHRFLHRGEEPQTLKRAPTKWIVILKEIDSKRVRVTIDKDNPKDESVYPWHLKIWIAK